MDFFRDGAYLQLLSVNEDKCALSSMPNVNTVEPRYIELAYFELPLISKWKIWSLF